MVNDACMQIGLLSYFRMRFMQGDPAPFVLLYGRVLASLTITESRRVVDQSVGLRPGRVAKVRQTVMSAL